MKHSHSLMHRSGADALLGTPWRVLKMTALLLLAGVHLSAQAAPTFTLKELTDTALQFNPSIQVIRAQEDAAQAAVMTSTSLINPEIEAGAGPSRYRSGNSDTRANWGVMVSQPLEFGDVRAARRSLAETGVRTVTAGSELARTQLRNQVRSAYFEVLHRQAVLKLVEDDKNLLSQIRDKVKLRVDVGESPRYELIKAETEMLAAERDYRAAQVRVEESKGLLRSLVGGSIPEKFEVSGSMVANTSLDSLAALQQKINDSPLMQQGRMLNESATAKLSLEEKLRTPGLTLKAGIEQDPDLTSFRFGVAIPLPLWNQRQGQIAEAAAGVRQTQAQLGERELFLKRELEAGFQRYQIARQQVATFESGLLRQAESVLKVAEAAYRYGERGILDYLDAQRTYRSVRKDHLNARYDLNNTVLEIERLLGTELLEEKP